MKQEQTAAAVAELAVGQQAKRPRTDPADSFGILPRSSTSTITLSTAIAPPLPTAHMQQQSVGPEVHTETVQANLAAQQQQAAAAAAAVRYVSTAQVPKAAPKKRKQGVVTDCEHTSRDHYGKGKCKQCYFR